MERTAWVSEWVCRVWALFRLLFIYIFSRALGRRLWCESLIIMVDAELLDAYELIYGIHIHCAAPCAPLPMRLSFAFKRSIAIDTEFKQQLKKKKKNISRLTFVRPCSIVCAYTSHRVSWGRRNTLPWPDRGPRITITLFHQIYLPLSSHFSCVIYNFQFSFASSDSNTPSRLRRPATHISRIHFPAHISHR